MKSNYSKLRKLEKEIEMLRNTYRDLRIEESRLVNFKKDFKRMGLWTDQKEYELKQIQSAITDANRRLTNAYGKRYYLHKKYIEEARDFYNPMDDVDIIMLIHKDGSIHGITL